MSISLDHGIGGWRPVLGFVPIKSVSDLRGRKPFTVIFYLFDQVQIKVDRGKVSPHEQLAHLKMSHPRIRSSTSTSMTHGQTPYQTHLIRVLNLRRSSNNIRNSEALKAMSPETGNRNVDSLGVAFPI